jgi:spermidine/putrescine transport system permease protein
MSASWTASGRQLAWRGGLASPIVVFVVVFALVPLTMLFLYSLWTNEFLGLSKDLTTANYRDLLGADRDVFVPVLLRTVALALMVTGVALVLGYASAYGLARHVPRQLRSVALLLLLIPLSTSYLVKVYAWRGLLGERGVINYSLLEIGVIDDALEFLLFNRLAVGIALVSATLPFMILPIYSAIERIPDRLLDAASDLGASRSHVFLRVIVPLTRRGILAGCTFVFVLSFGDFIASQLLGGRSGLLIGKVIYSQFGLADDWPTGAAMAFTVLLVAALILAAFGWISRRGGGATDVAADTRLTV